MKIPFTKMHGAGNDYIYINCFDRVIDEPEALSRYVSHRRFGIGSDGLVLILPSNAADFKMRIFNADGSEAMMCGNATRCVGKYVYERHMTHKTDLALETNSGIKYLELAVENGLVTQVSVDMGKAVLTPRDIPVNAGGDRFVARPVEIGGTVWELTCVSMGNPHAVVFVEDTGSLDLEALGPQFERHPLFPNRVNTEFIQVVDGHTLKMRVWERGSGETWACGTGACAAAVAAVLNGHCPMDEEIFIHLTGGDLRITWKEDGAVLMKGPAVQICEGTVEFPPLP